MRSCLKTRSTFPVRSISATNLPKRSGSASAASTIAAIFSTWRPETPAKLPVVESFHNGGSLALPQMGGLPLLRLRFLVGFDRPPDGVDLAREKRLAL